MRLWSTPQQARPEQEEDRASGLVLRGVWSHHRLVHHGAASPGRRLSAREFTVQQRGAAYFKLFSHKTGMLSDIAFFNELFPENIRINPLPS